MKLKELVPGMVVECTNLKEKKMLLEEAERLGYLWQGGYKPTEYMNDGLTIHFYDVDEITSYKHITWSNHKGDIKFSDLIISELSAEEVLKICNDICTGLGCDECPMNGNCYSSDTADYKKVVEICEQWKADHEKKEPELERVNVCRIIQVQDNGVKKCVYEKDITGLGEYAHYSAVEDKAEEILKRYMSMYDGNYIAVVEHVCRVKKGE